MFVTILTDASRDPDSGVSGWACWIASDRGKTSIGGPIRDVTSSSDAAELAAICNAVHEAFRLALLRPGDDLLIQTDSMNAQSIYYRRRLAYTDDEKLAMKWLSHFTSVLRRVTVKHVKAHTGYRDKRSWCNEQCDTEAKTHMRQLRDRLQEMT